MRLKVDHRTTYRFATPQRRLTQLLRLTPSGTDGQTVVDWRLHVDCDARLRDGRDGFGNRITMLYIAGPIASLELEVVGEVLTSGSDGILRGSSEPLPPEVYLRPTPLTAADAEIAAFAADAIGAATDGVEQMHRLNLQVHDRFTATGGPPDATRAASASFRDGSADARDRAQILLVALRSVGIPGRYISGYHLEGPAETHDPAPHGWVEAHAAGLGWIAFDPSTGLSADQGYVRVAAALDSYGAAPVAGTRLGSGAEELDVDVMVRPQD